MKKFFNKKALSDIVSTLLILLLVFVAVAILWVVVRNVIQQGTEQISLGKLTLNLEIEQVSIDENLNQVSVVVNRKIGAGEFVGMKFIISDDEQSESFSINQTLKEGEMNFFDFNLERINCTAIQKIEVAPIFRLSSGKEVIGNIKDVWEKEEGIFNEGGSNLSPDENVGKECTIDINCTTDYYSDNYCNSGDVYRNFYDFSCNSSQQCTYSINSQLINDCNSTQTCSGNICVNNPAQNETNPSDIIISGFNSPGEWSLNTLDSGIYVEGSSSLRWNHSSTGNVLMALSGELDLSSGNYISLWINNNIADNEGIHLVVYSENSATTGTDYYAYEVPTSVSGWLHVVIPKSSFSVSRTPLGWNHITGITFSASGWSHTINPNRIVYLDNLRLTNNSTVLTPPVSVQDYLSSPLPDGTCPEPLTMDTSKGGCVCNAPDCHFECKNQILDGNWASAGYFMSISSGGVISNCTLRNWHAASVVHASSASNVLIEFSIFENISSGTIGVDGHAFDITTSGHYITVRNSTFRNIGSDGIQLGNSGTDGSITDVLIIGNTFEITSPHLLNGRLNGEEGIDLKFVSDNIKVLNNIFSGFRPCVRTTHECTNSLGSGIALNRGGLTGYSRNVLIEGNIFKDSSMGVAVLFGSNHTIRNNFVYDVRQGFQISTNVTSVFLDHNTIASIGADIDGYGDSLFIRCTNCNACTARNNLFFGSSATNQCTTSQNNIIFSDESQSSSIFVNYASRNLHLRSTASSVINHGVSAGVLRDFDNQLRDSSPDVGADEYI